MSIDAISAADLLRALTDELSRKAPANPYCATLAARGRAAADALDASRAPPVRFFGRIEAATLECPACGAIHQFGLPGRHSKRQWDPATARLYCRGCHQTSVLAIVAWQIRPGTQRSDTPRDQIPDGRQRAQLRALAQSWWLAERVSRHPTHTNVRMAPECTCPPGAEGSGEGCPVHRKGDS